MTVSYGDEDLRESVSEYMKRIEKIFGKKTRFKTLAKSREELEKRIEEWHDYRRKLDVLFEANEKGIECNINRVNDFYYMKDLENKINNINKIIREKHKKKYMEKVNTYIKKCGGRAISYDLLPDSCLTCAFANYVDDFYGSGISCNNTSLKYGLPVNILFFCNEGFKRAKEDEVYWNK